MKTIKPEPKDLDQMSREELVKLVLELMERIEKLEGKQEKDAKSSSKPPSSDLIKKSEKKKESVGEGKRKAGGQKKHEGKTRKGFGRVDRSERVDLAKCPDCRASLETAKILKMETRTIAELVARPIEVVEYQRRQCRCRECGQVSAAEWPESIMGKQDLGVNLQSYLGWLGDYGNLPYEKQQEMLWELGAIEVGRGTLVKTHQRLAEALVTPYEEAEQWVEQTSPPLHIDETPWSVQGVKEWLWVFATETLCLFRGADTRSRAEVQAQIGQRYEGVIISDDFSVYNGYDCAAQQKCLAHLRRHFQALIQQPGLYNRQIGAVFKRLIDEAFEHHALFRQSLDRGAWDTWVVQFRSRCWAHLDYWRPLAGAAANRLLDNLRSKADQWWFFLDNPHIPPDNNLAERALRLAVTKRKVSGGSRSLDSLRLTARCLSVIQSCRFQARSVLTFFRQALLAASRSSVPSPSLLPSP